MTLFFPAFRIRSPRFSFRNAAAAYLDDPSYQWIDEARQKFNTKAVVAFEVFSMDCLGPQFLFTCDWVLSLSSSM